MSVQNRTCQRIAAIKLLTRERELRIKCGGNKLELTAVVRPTAG